MSEGKRLKSFPLHLVYLPIIPLEEKEKSVQIAFSAPKRIHKLAVDRNRLKRRVREAYRPFIPQLEAFMEENGTACACMLIYVGSEALSTQEIATRLKSLLDRFKLEFNPPSTDEQA